MKVVLELQEQLANVRKVTVRHDIVIGRGADCNLRLSAPQISRRHCFLRVGREGVSITDLDSSNGTFVDGRRIPSGQRTSLSTGAVLSLGPVKFTVHIREDSVAPEVLRSESERSAKVKSSSGSSERSTVVSDMDGIVRSGSPSDKVMRFAVEQAGASAEAHEPTADLVDDRHSRGASGFPRRGIVPEHLDSRAEIVDLGRRIAALDAAGLARDNGDDVDEDSPEEPQTAGGIDQDLSRRTADQASQDPETTWNAAEAPEGWKFFASDEDDVPEAAFDAGLSASHDGEQAAASAPRSEQFSADAAPGSLNENVELHDDLIVDADVLELDEHVDVVEWLDDESIEVIDDGPDAEAELVEEVVEVLDDDSDEIIEVVDDPDELPVDEEEIVEVVEVVEEELEATAKGTDSEIIEVTDENAGGNWFTESSGKDDDADPELKQFLKGF